MIKNALYFSGRSSPRFIMVEYKRTPTQCLVRYTIQHVKEVCEIPSRREAEKQMINNVKRARSYCYGVKISLFGIALKDLKKQISAFILFCLLFLNISDLCIEILIINTSFTLYDIPRLFQFLLHLVVLVWNTLLIWSESVYLMVFEVNFYDFDASIYDLNLKRQYLIDTIR